MTRRSTAERIRAAIDEIADEPEPVARRPKRDLAQQCVEGRRAALNVADREQPHSATAAAARQRLARGA